jgi:hypothetical protein
MWSFKNKSQIVDIVNCKQNHSLPLPSSWSPKVQNVPSHTLHISLCLLKHKHTPFTYFIFYLESQSFFLNIATGVLVKLKNNEVSILHVKIK